MEPMNCPVVERFSLSELTFPESDVLTTPEEKSARRADLHRATQLGNLSRTKVRVEFWDALGCKVLQLAHITALGARDGGYTQWL